VALHGEARWHSTVGKEGVLTGVDARPRHWTNDGFSSVAPAVDLGARVRLDGARDSFSRKWHRCGFELETGLQLING
jgi:hypothetical protein